MQQLAERIFIGKDASRQRLVDHGDPLRAFAVALVDDTTFQQRDPQRLEIPWSYFLHAGLRLLFTGRIRPAHDPKRLRIRGAGDRRRADSGNRRQTFLHLLIKQRGLRGNALQITGKHFDVLRGPQLDSAGQKVLGVVADIDLLQPQHAVDHQPGADQQHERQRHLADGQDSVASVAASTRRLTAALLEHRHQVELCRPPCWCQTEQDSGQQRDRQRKQQDVAVDSDLIHPRKPVRRHRQKDPQAAPAHEHSDGAADQAEQQALGQQLLEQPAASRAKRQADGDLFLPPCPARQQQIRHVGAGDQQNQSRRAEQHIQNRTGAAGIGLAERFRLSVSSLCKRRVAVRPCAAQNRRSLPAPARVSLSA